MSFDIYGNPLRRGYCEVHPQVAEEYPCQLCHTELGHHREREQREYDNHVLNQQLAELQAKYDKAMAFVAKTYNKRFVSPVTKDAWDNIIEEAKKLLKELGEHE